MTDETIFWYQLDPSQRAATAESFRGGPFPGCSASLRVYNALMRHNARIDVAVLMMAGKSITDVYQLGKGWHWQKSTSVCLPCGMARGCRDLHATCRCGST